MRIAQIAPISERVPPKRYGGTERIVFELTEELVRRGHDVTLFASGDSIISAKLASVLPVSLRESNIKNPYGLSEYTFLNFGLAYDRQAEFDIIHDHNYAISIPTAAMAKTPVIMTVHGALHEENIPLYQSFPQINLVTISKAQSPKRSSLHIVGTVYHGQTMGHYPFGKQHEGYLLFVGRMHKEKGVHHAIEVARRLDLPLIIAARVADVDVEYFTAYIKPKLTDKIIWIGEVNEQERNELMSKAMCFLHPVTWPEPFGLTMIESMACGAPVVAFNKGSIPEVVNDGYSGYVVENIEQMVDGVKKVIDNAISRKNCREYALNTFSVQQMTDGYEAIYRKVLARKVIKTPEEIILPLQHNFTDLVL